jgi:hypothetical protein
LVCVSWVVNMCGAVDMSNAKGRREMKRKSNMRSNCKRWISCSPALCKLTIVLEVCCHCHELSIVVKVYCLHWDFLIFFWIFLLLFITLISFLLSVFFFLVYMLVFLIPFFWHFNFFWIFAFFFFFIFIFIFLVFIFCTF